MVFSFSFSYDKINNNKKYTLLKPICFLYVFYKKKMEPEGQEFGRTEWYLIVHDIENNKFFVCVFLQIKKLHQTRNRYQ